MNSYKAHFRMDSGVAFTLDVQCQQTKSHDDLKALYAELDKLAERLGARFISAEYVGLRERRKEMR
jgi:virulence-associated protein VapD